MGEAIIQNSTWLIEHGHLRVLTQDDVFAPDVSPVEALKKIPSTDDGVCETSAANVFFVSANGLRIKASDIERGCNYTWAKMLPLLAKDSVIEVLAKRFLKHAPDLPTETTAGWAAAPRFVAHGNDEVFDNYTHLTWAARDNGADIDAEAADAYAKAYRGGGHDDWRLPTERELELLADPAMSHREKTDCTKGKSSYTLTSLVHVSCGLIWTAVSGSGGPTRTGMGFISGTPRVSKVTETKNYRALVVRGP